MLSWWGVLVFPLPREPAAKPRLALLAGRAVLRIIVLRDVYVFLVYRVVRLLGKNLTRATGWCDRSVPLFIPLSFRRLEACVTLIWRDNLGYQVYGCLHAVYCSWLSTWHTSVSKRWVVFPIYFVAKYLYSPQTYVSFLARLVSGVLIEWFGLLLFLSAPVPDVSDKLKLVGRAVLFLPCVARLTCSRRGRFPISSYLHIIPSHRIAALPPCLDVSTATCHVPTYFFCFSLKDYKETKAPKGARGLAKAF